MYQIIASILPIFIITLLGKLIKTHWIKSKEFWKGLESLSYYLLFPIVLFNYISKADVGAFYLIKLVIALITSTIITILALIAIKQKYEINGKIFTSIFQGSVRYNSYIFFALGDALFGTEGMIAVSVIAAYMIVFTNIISVAAFSFYAPRKDEISIKRGESQWYLLTKNLITNPLIIASIAGFMFNNFDIEVSKTLQKTLSTLSGSALPIGILCVGSNLKFNILEIDKFALILSSMIKLILLPVITFIILTLMDIKGTAYSIGLLYSALPTATNSYLLSKKLGGDSDSMSAIITTTILFSVFSLTLLMYILAKIN